MTTSADRILADGLERHGRGADLSESLASSTENEVRLRYAVASLRPSRTSPWVTWYARLAGARGRPDPVDECFRWTMQTYAPRSSEVVRAVARHLVAGLGSLDAVCEVLNEQSVGALERRWCALGGGLYAPNQVAPYLRPYLAPGFSTLRDRLAGLTSWVHGAIVWVSDARKWHTPDYWQAPATTLMHGTGDCEDQALVLWSAASLLALPAGVLVIGTLDGHGHAWVEFPELPLATIADPTSGLLYARDFAPQYVARLRINPPRNTGSHSV